MAKKHPEGLWPRGDQWYLIFYDVAGIRQRKPSGYKLSQVKEAVAMRKAIIADITKGKHIESCHYTVMEWAEEWRKSRQNTNLGADLDYGRIENHFFPAFGKMRLTAVKREEIRDFVLSLRVPEKDLAPRTIRNVWWAVSRMFSDAVPKQLETSPCAGALKRGDIPKMRDKNRRWRQTAIYTRTEAEQLFSDARLDEDHRVLWAFGFLAGLRMGEISALRWRDYDAVQAPLGRLTISSSYTRVNKKEKGTKTENTRQVPVHPTLATILAQWKLSGWPALFGAKPKDDDLVLPNRWGTYLTDNTTRKSRPANFEVLGLEPRRFHDARRTFISLAQADGGLPHVLKLITHTPAEIMDLYTTLPWATLCEAVSKLKLEARKGELVQLRVVSNGPSGPPSGPEGGHKGGNLSQSLSQTTARTAQPLQSLSKHEWAGRESNPRVLNQTAAHGRNSGTCDEGGPPRNDGEAVSCDSVTAAEAAVVVAAVKLVAERFETSGDELVAAVEHLEKIRGAR